jgi:hypothetical protein
MGVARTAVAVLLVVGACKKAPAPPSPSSEVAKATADAEQLVRDQALQDLQNDLITLKLQLGVVSDVAMATAAKTTQPRSSRGALYTCDRVSVAQRVLADVPRAQAALGEAESLCAYQAPLAAAVEQMNALDKPAAPVAASATECASLHEVLQRVGEKYRNDGDMTVLVARFKAHCPRAHPFAAGHASRASSSVSPAAKGQDPEACRQRCKDAAWSCSTSCQYCGSCTNDKTWEWCNQTCNTCKQSCEHSEAFCKASCGG